MFGFGLQVRAALSSRRQCTTLQATRSSEGKGFGSSQSPYPENIKSSVSETPIPVDQSSDDNTITAAATPSSPSIIPASPKNDVFQACITTSSIIATVALVIKVAATTFLPSISSLSSSPTLSTTLSLLQWPLPAPSSSSSPYLTTLGLAAGTAALVTTARLVLLAAWPDFKSSSDRSNTQVLGNLTPLDLLWVAVLPGISEELLFRGALIPVISPDIKGAIISGLVFGSLHVNGGRGTAFATWSTAIGVVYGGLFLSTGCVWAAVVAHCLSNIVSGGIWIFTNRSGSSTD